jgi:methyl-accepting chemotaxis protein
MLVLRHVFACRLVRNTELLRITMFPNMKTRTRLLAGFAIVALLGMLVAVTGIVNMGRMNEQAQRGYRENLLGMSSAKEASIDLARIGRSIRGAILARNEADRKKADADVDDARAKMHVRLDAARAVFTSTEGKDLFERTEPLEADMEAKVARLRELARVETPEGKDAALDYLQAQVTPANDLLANQLAQLGQHKERDAAQAAEQAGATYRSTRATMIALVLGGLVLSAAFAIVITRTLMRQLGGEPLYAVQAAGAIAGGDLSTPVRVRSGDNTSLVATMEAMRASLAGIVREVRSGTDTIATAASEISLGNMDLSSRTEQQAGSLEETASSMEELTSTVRQNADNARQANVLAASASEVATRGGTVVAQVVDTMSSINESSKRIVDIISVIDGIAFQTNILALNAAVEAARAGEQGRGFAVVASEVRNLAQRSAAAAKEIKTLIHDSVGKVESGGKLVQQAGATMGEIVQSITRVTDIMSEIASASQEQSSGIEQVNEAISQMDQATQQNAALVEQAAAAATSMQEQAATLAKVVGSFRLETAVHAKHSRAPLKGATPAKPARTAPRLARAAASERETV